MGDPGICRIGRPSDAGPADRGRTGSRAPGGCGGPVDQTLDGLESKQDDKDAAAVSQLEADQAQTINVRK